MKTMLARKMVACCTIAAAGACATAAHAQTASQGGPLSVFVNDGRSTATDLQRQAGYAVQGMCGALGREGGLQLTGAKGDLFLRCNEMVETARRFQGIPQVTGRDLGYADRAQLLAAVQQVSGEEIAAQGVMSTQVSSGQFSNIGGRLTALRMGSNRQRLGGGASADDEGSADQSRVGWFLESSYGFGDHDQTASEDAFDYDAMSFTTGTDYNFGAGVVGVSVGYDRYQADFDSALFVTGGDVEVDGISGSLFAGYFGDGLTVSGIATYGSLESEVTRHVIYDTGGAACTPTCGARRSITGSPDGSYVALGVTLGYDFNVAGWDITPSVSGSYRDVDVDGFSESDPSGGLALRYDDQTIESTRSIVGIAFSRPISQSFGVLVPSLRAEWHHEFEDDVRAVRAKYVLEDSLLTGASGAQDFGCAISCFTMLADQADSDYAVASVGVSATFPRRIQFYLFYEALLGAANINGNSIAGGVRGQF